MQMAYSSQPRRRQGIHETRLQHNLSCAAYKCHRGSNEREEMHALPGAVPTPAYSTNWWADDMSNKLCRPPFSLTWSVSFTQADLSDAAGVTLRSSPLQNAVLVQPVGWCHGGEKSTVRVWKAWSPSAKVTGIKWRSRPNVVRLQQQQLLVPDKQQCWGSPLRAQHHAAFNCCS